MTISSPKPAPDSVREKRILAPKAPVLVLNGRKLFCLTLEGELGEVSADAARHIIRQHMPIVCHAPQLGARLGIERLQAYDVLELFAFVRPGTFCTPTPRGLARTLHLLEPDTAEDQCLSLRDTVRHLLADLATPVTPERSDPAPLAAMMGRMQSAEGGSAESGWPWTPAILAAIGRNAPPPTRGEIKAALKIWDKLPEWSIHAPPASPGHHGVDAAEATDRLHKLLARQGKEDRPQQRAYATELATAFAPCNVEGQTHVVMAEAGTGTGKTLGYLSPATVWAEKNGGAVWVSTYTRNLQRQVDAELGKLYDDEGAKARKVVTRKGRENYLCLLNLEDAAQSPAVHASDTDAVALGLMTRWAAVTEDGDLAGKDFPGWLPGIIGRNRVGSLSDRRGECIYSACPHFNKCFVEKSIRKAKRADIVIANHALVMSQVAIDDFSDLPARYIFDEGHHLFEAADNAFSAHLNGTETAELRRWVLGTETGGRSRARGLKRRIEDIVAGDDTAQAEVEKLIETSRILPGPSWRQRLSGNQPKGVAETFLMLCRQQVYARNKETAGPYSLETASTPPIPGLLEAAQAFAAKLKDMQRPMLALVKILERKLDDEAETLDTDARERIRFMISSLQRRARDIAGAWISMLDSLSIALRKEVPAHVDWFEVTRIDGADYDTGFHRHYIDPAQVFAATLKPHAQGVVITSATLRDVSEKDPAGWNGGGSARTGLQQLDESGTSTRLFTVPSPFDYAVQTRILIVGDVKKDNPEEVASAFRALFLSSGGGALGIFTAVQRLRAVHGRILPALEEEGLNLYAQHADGLDVSTLIDIFREEENACLLGTDATRDGIDVPGRALRLVVYDRVPWPRPTLLHKARRDSFGRDYDDMLTRFKLKQAYGRLIRKADDKGVFVLLDGALPSRLLTAFPEGTEILRVGLKEAVEQTKVFLS
jgi:ATP-dependent DNA helicase DinG